MIRTKKQALKEFNELIKLSKIPRTDKIAKAEAWNNYIDSLCEDKLVTNYQRDHWSNPF